MNAVKMLLMFDILMASVTPLLGKWKAWSERKRMLQLKRFPFDITGKQCIFSKMLCPYQLFGENFTNGTVVVQNSINLENI